MTTQIAIYNMALSAIGTRTNVSSTTEANNEAGFSIEAVQCNLWWQPIMDMVFRGVYWNFARAQGYLSLLNDATQGQPVPQPWLYEYIQPSDCLAMRNIMPMTQAAPITSTPPTVVLPDYVGPPVRFIISSDLDKQNNPQTVILTNQPNAMGVWTSRITNPANWDASFVMMMVKVLAAHLAISLSGDKAMAKLKMDEASRMLIEARRTNGNEGLTVHDHIPEWMRVRGYASDWAYPDGGFFNFGPQNLSLIT